MKLSNSFFITRKEIPNDEETLVGKLLVKSGMIYKNNDGTYMYLPLGFKVLENIKKIIREEHNKNNYNEVLMPSLINNKVYKKSNRIKLFNKELFNIKDRDDNELCLTPTDEELFSILANLKIKSYKDLHFILYQISNKYRDEENTKSIIRQKEFLMCDSYSFDSTESGLSISYDEMFSLYSRIFKRMNIDYLVAEADPGYMNGTFSQEFHFVSEIGNDEIVKCTKCSYTANRLDAIALPNRNNKEEENKKIEKVYTPNIKTIKDISNYLNIKENKIIKSLIYKIDNEYVLILVLGNDEVNESKLNGIFKGKNIRLATENEINDLGSYIGYIGPIKATMKVIADFSIKFLTNLVCGSNIKDYHYINVTPEKDFKINKYADIKLFTERDKCPLCKEEVNIYKTIEIANIFKLGTIYSDLFDLKYSDEKNEYNRVQMGSYGIGIERCLSAIIENNHDDNGIIWPIDVAPYKVIIIIVNMLDREAHKYGNDLYDRLNDLGIETMLDDRNESPGVKFKDADLIGIPIRIVIGYKYSDDIIELKLRSQNEKQEIKKEEILESIKKVLNI